ncbi:hypothetical protein [Brachybacterium muris]|uniref:Uncharacterized protein n=1 Tax=Brachybacterium muris UCD-AY4 TaxID=1249481 RepID=A0A022KQ36_9MICO|nr:hypothetical protein [Brachybacterium muris]EYT47948.1 hypothetical protein D641_0114140 [Brachybacterium muris UCD-AY4]MCT1654886.1 hypothetical protein [Brachybacterium muris]
MTARRSDDPITDAPDPASSLEYWTKERRRAANPAPMDRELPTQSADDRAEESEDPPSTCDDTEKQGPDATR